MKKVVRKLFFAWNEEKEKLFLEEMALKGYRLIEVRVGKYTFEEDIPKKLTYQFDFRTLDKKSNEEYLQLYKDAGWHFVQQYGGWYYFCREKTDEENDLSIFNNNKSKRAKYQRLLFFLLLTGFPLYYNIIFLFPAMAQSEFEFPKFYFFFQIFVVLLTCLHLFAIGKIVYVYKKLRNHIKE